MKEVLEPNPDGTDNARAYDKMCSLTYTGVVNPQNGYAVQCGLVLLFRNIFVGPPTTLLSTLLAVYAVARQSCTRNSMRTVKSFVGGTLNVATYTAFLAVRNPVTGLALKDTVCSLHLHPVYKDQGSDIFYENGLGWWKAHAELSPPIDVKRVILLTALFFLSVRSEAALTYFMADTSRLLRDIFDFGRLYQSVALPSTPFIGLRGNKNKGVHTTEQKTRGAGLLLDILLHPGWNKPKQLDDLLLAKTAKSFTDALKVFSGFSGDLVFTHTMEYLQLWDQACDNGLFSYHMSKKTMAEYVKPGKNSQMYLSIMNNPSQRGRSGSSSMTSLAKSVVDVLPTRVEFYDDTTASNPHFYATDGSQNVCKLIQCFQLLLTSQAGGHQRNQTALEKVKALAAQAPVKQHRLRKGKCRRPARSNRSVIKRPAGAKP